MFNELRCSRGALGTSVDRNGPLGNTKNEVCRLPALWSMEHERKKSGLSEEELLITILAQY